MGISELGSNFLKSMINLANKSTSLNVVDDQIGGQPHRMKSQRF